MIETEQKEEIKIDAKMQNFLNKNLWDLSNEIFMKGSGAGDRRRCPIS